MGLTALLAAAALPLAPAQSEAQAEFVARDSFGGSVTDGSLFYASTPSGRSAISRLDLTTGERRIVYMAPNRRTSMPALEVGGARVAFETRLGFTRSAVLVMDTGTEAVVEVARGRLRGDGCGRAVKLDDVSPSGEVLLEEAVVPCSGGEGHFRVLAHDPASGTRTLVARPTREAFLSDGPPYRRLSGDQLLTFGERAARVRDLSSGAVRRLSHLMPRGAFGVPDVAADGRVLIDEWRFRARRPEQLIRMVGAGGEGRAGTVVHRSRREFGEARFCGNRAVLATTAGVRFRVRLLDPPRPLVDGLLPDPDIETSCDAARVVATVAAHGRGDRVYVYELPPP